ncbi:MAG TPA: branched-chain-amino-acid transaminase [Phnomibacter sp.]|nr:branched-chain-amino-acid transaminase [Phnomibacter sp.]
MNYYNANTIIYHNGQYVKAADAVIDLYSQTMHYGYGVFEGIRSYALHNGATGIFEAEAHFERLQKSAQSLNLPYPFDNQHLVEATYKVLQLNNLQDAYIRPLIYAPANMSFKPNEVSCITIQAWPMAPFLGENLLRLMISSYQRPNPKAFLMHAKACGHYVNSILASQEAKANGYDEALLLDSNGRIAEGPGANFFLEKEGSLITPAPGHILAGITRATILKLCQALGIAVTQADVNPEDLYTADSAFYCGTAAEVIGIASINDYSFAKPWPLTQGALLQKAYALLVRGYSIHQITQQLAPLKAA